MRTSSCVKVGNVLIGGGADISIQSMTNTKTHDIDATLAQINELYEHGCDIVRMAVNDDAAAAAVGALVDKSPVPLVADIHFDYKLAIRSAEAGISKLRINPGNIGGQDRVRVLADCAKAHRIPIRIGVNQGSVQKDLLRKYGSATPDAMIESALSHVKMLEDCGFYDIVISIKTADAMSTVEVYEKLANACSYPLHLGMTHTGLIEDARMKVAVGMGGLLMKGIGDTIRISLVGSPVPEVDMAKELLKATGHRKEGIELIACPTCARTSLPVQDIATKVKQRTSHIKAPVKAAVMGCVVNGPGEAREADIGITGAPGGWVIFEGNEVKKVSAENALEIFIASIERIAREKYGR